MPDSRGLLPRVEALAADCTFVEEISWRRRAGRGQRRPTRSFLSYGCESQARWTIVTMPMRWILYSAWRVSLAFLLTSISIMILDSLHMSFVTGNKLHEIGIITLGRSIQRMRAGP
ncbi:uncharacterized protein LOC119311228 [Triticum dicoccoides]|uniref:uncharacterized protein LOC119311228 n=1 Tax=Triticum dicoccoides TaxID=85692 RepID=UPI00188FB7EA|nr:uncharacterized protein LOC119311228 [Triticum dicoccoides]